MPARSVCFRTPRLSLGHPSSFKSAHDLKCMRTQTASTFNVPRGRRAKQVTAWTRSDLNPGTLSNCGSKKVNAVGFEPRDHRLVIQVLSSPRMILNACVRRLHPCLTSLAEDGALPQEYYTNYMHAGLFPNPGFKPGTIGPGMRGECSTTELHPSPKSVFSL